ncbi:hypothetical protein [Neobacillus mesonae]|uniref:hypothetical protein n=1 Tax=Neobacillus mesonae TaxID=1193713 RepID=UPI002E206DBF|nr:hypothetical protein [Neobacillus mesonae]
MNTQKLWISLFLLFALLSGCGLETKTLPEFYETDLDDITKIQILDGSTGYKKVINDKKVIEDFLGEIKKIKFIPEENQEDRIGFRYTIAFFEGEKITFSFTLNKVRDNYYYTDPDIHPIVDDFYKKLEAKEE